MLQVKELYEYNFFMLKLKKINDVIYVPKIKRNLLSIGCISSHDYAIEFMKSTSLNQEMKTHIILGKGHKIGTLKGFIDLKQKVL